MISILKFTIEIHLLNKKIIKKCKQSPYTTV